MIIAYAEEQSLPRGYPREIGTRLHCWSLLRAGSWCPWWRSCEAKHQGPSPSCQIVPDLPQSNHFTVSAPGPPTYDNMTIILLAKTMRVMKRKNLESVLKSYNPYGWKRPLKSLSPTANLTPLCSSLNMSPKATSKCLLNTSRENLCEFITV